MVDWDDLRIFIAAARAQSFSGAAIQLHLDAATVGRRIARLESGLKSTLLVRTRNGVQLTATGTQLLGVAETAEKAMGGVERAARSDAVAGRDANASQAQQRIAGPFRPANAARA
jgi:DNA-binding transcriptional LysR family regulator